jgi:PAS domain S-box-containing protein
MRAEVRIALIYAAIGILWILFSDALSILIFGSNPMLLTIVQANKGIFYVVATALLLYSLLSYELKQRQQQENKFQLMFQHNPNPMWVYDPQTLTFLEVNEQGIETHGYSRDEFLGMSLKDIRPSEDITALLDSVKNRKQTMETGRWRHKTRTGKLLDVEITSQQLEYEGRRAILVVARDITERKELQAQRQMNEDLRMQLEKEHEAHHKRSRFFSMVSHEFRTPLATITSSSSLLQRYDERLTPEKRSEYYQKILKQAHVLSEQLDEMLMLLRTELSTANYQPQPADIVELCQEVVETFTMSTSASRLISFECSQPKMMIDMDRKLIWRVMTNLVGNALKYSPDDKSVAVTLTIGNPGIEICVKDEGIGIPVVQQEKLFEPFFRANNAENIQGTGLGLTIVKQAIELHGGTIRVESAEGKGTCFTIELPLLQPYIVDEDN